MNPVDAYALEGRRLIFRPVGPSSLVAAIDMVSDVMAFALQQHAREVLVNLTELTAIDQPNLFERYEAINTWARASKGILRLVLVTRPELIDPQRFGVTVARNRGFVANVFATEAEALAWLDSLAAATDKGVG